MFRSIFLAQLNGMIVNRGYIVLSLDGMLQFCGISNISQFIGTIQEGY